MVQSYPHDDDQYVLAVYNSNTDSTPILKARVQTSRSFTSAEVDAFETYPELKGVIPNINPDQLCLITIGGFRKDHNTVVTLPGPGYVYFAGMNPAKKEVEIIQKCTFSRAEESDSEIFSTWVANVVAKTIERCKGATP